jgi:conjugal transfer pilus assembly protein TraB
VSNDNTEQPGQPTQLVRPKLAFFTSLNAKQKKYLVLGCIGAGLMVISTFGYFASHKKNNQGKLPPRQENKAVDMGNDLLKKNDYLDAQSRVSQAEDKAKMYQQQIEDIKSGKTQTVANGVLGQNSSQPGIPAGLIKPEAAQQQNGQQRPNLAPLYQVGPKKQKTAESLPPLPDAGTGLPPLPPSARQHPGGNVPLASAASDMGEVEIGGISRVINNEKKDAGKDGDKKKDEMKSVYLPPSYMVATILSGLYAPVSSDAKGNPVPVLIRVSAPAQLPNAVKAQLRGCFAVADGKGNLGTERAELVLVSLNCVDRKGNAVIDQDIKGYVVGADGIAGVRGKVVAKTGQLIARAAFAGFFGGVGDALKTSSQTTGISPLGAVNTLSSDKLWQAGVGGGVSEGFKEIQKFYMELAHQTMPTIEILPSQPVTLVVTKGVDLNIRKLSKGTR